MQLKLLIISKYSWLENLLKQYFFEFEIITTPQISQDADIIVNQANEKDVNITIRDKAWLLPKPISILTIINIIEHAKQLLSEAIITIGPITFYPQQKLCKFAEEDIELTQKETEILLYLAKNSKEVDKITLLNTIWGYSDNISTHTLETHIYKLRMKFAGKHDLILSKDLGYILNI